MAFDDSILDIAYDAIFTLDARTSSITSWNGGAEVMYGYTRDEALGRPAGELLRSRFRTTRAQVMWELDATGRWEGDIVQTSKAGAEITVAARWALRRGGAGEPDVILEVNRNVTAERELARRFQLLVDSVREYAIFLLDPDGRVASWNTGAERMKGYAPDEIIGRDVSVFYTPEDRASGVPERAMGAAAAEGQHSQEVQCLRRDGSRFWATEVLTPLRDASGRVTAFAKVVRDDTGKRLEMERLHELDRAKTNLMNLAAHELRGPLTLISGYLAMLDEGTFGELDGRLRGALPALRARTGEMNQMIEQMVESARIEEGTTELDMRSVELADVAAEAVRSQSLLLDSGHEIRLEAGSGGVVVRGDPARIRTVISNLLNNAVKYTPDGGDVVCRVGRTGDRGTVSVEDCGIGISEEEIPALFTKFGRLVRPETRHIAGTGLGLYLSRELARLQGGDITVRSVPGEGSVFTLELPVEATRAAHAGG